MRDFSHLPCKLLLGILLLLETLVCHGAPIPWQETLSPARFVIEPNDANARGTVGVVQIHFPNPAWEKEPFCIFDDTGKAIPCRLLWNAPGEPATLLIDTTSNSKTYFLYVTPGSIDKEINWTPPPQAGVILETREGTGKAVDNLERMIRAWDDSKTVYGRSMLRQIFEGGHRHGPQEDILSHYTGWFEVSKPTRYSFALISVDASFLLIDGKLVVQWPGRHPYKAGWKGKFQGSVELPAGIHELEYYNAYVSRNESRPLICCLAAKIGNGGWNMLMPESHFFRPITFLHTARYEPHPPLPPFVPGGAPRIDLPPAPPLAISWNITSQSVPTPETDDIGLIDVQFYTLPPLPKGTPVWTFDDGTKASGNKVDHIFPCPGMRTVKLSFMDGDKETASISQTVHVHPNWTSLTTQRPDLNPKQRDEILERDPTTFTPTDLGSCAQVFQIFEDADAIAKILPGLCLRAREMDEKNLTYLLDAATFLSSTEIHRFADADQLLKAIIERPAPPALLADQARLLLAKNILSTSDQMDDVITLSKTIHPETLPPDQRREYDILQGDILLAKGDIEGTKKQYLKLSKDLSGIDARSSVRRISRLDQARSFMDTKDFDSAEKSLNDILSEAPIEKLSPDFALVYIRLLQSRDDTQVAYLLAKRLLPFLTMPSTRSDLLFHVTDLAFLQQDKKFAQKALTELIQNYPYSEAAAQAKQKWPTEIPRK